MKFGSRIIFGSGRIVSWPDSARWNLLPTKRWERLLNRAVDLGINAFDTGRIYSSEGLFGRFISQHDREKLIIISKGGHPGLVFKTSLSQKAIERDLVRSLKALDTDYIDIYLFHFDDPKVSIDQLVDWSLALLENGKAKHIGYSNMSLSRFEECHVTLQREGIVPWLSNEFNLFEPVPERWPRAQNMSRDRAFIDYLIQHNIPLVAYSPLGRGYLKKHGSDSGQRRGETADARIIRVKELSREYGVSPSTVALKYILQFSANFYPIVATSNLQHLEDNMKAQDLEMSHADFKSLCP